MKYLKLTLTLISLVVKFIQNAAINSNCPDQFCTTKACISTAHNLLINIDFSLDPCDDFYKFSCGGYMETKMIADYDQLTNNYVESYSKILQFLLNILERPISKNDTKDLQNAKLFFKSCMNEDYIDENNEQAIKKFLKDELGGWALIQKTDNLTQFQQFYENYKIDKPEYTFTLEDYENKKYMDAYKSFIRFVAINLNPLLDPAKLDQDISDMVELEKALRAKEPPKDYYEIKKSRNRLLKLFKNHDRLKYTDDFDFNVYFSTSSFIYEALDLIEEKEKLNNDSRLNINADYIELSEWSEYDVDENKQAELNKKKFLRKMNIISIWFILKDNIRFFPKKYQIAKQRFDRIILGLRSYPSREKICVSDVSTKMPLLMTKLYYEKFFKQKYDTNPTIEMFERMKSLFLERIEKTEWMDQESREKTISKIKTLKLLIAHEDIINNASIMNRLYENYTFNEYDFLDNEITRIKALSKLDESFLTGYVDSPLELNAILDLYSEFIFFSVGLFQEPFYSEDRPNYLNYANIGFIIGHELLHGFEYMDKSICKELCWTNQTYENFDNITDCLVKQYNKYEIKNINLKLNGSVLLKENIADAGAMDISYSAYKSWLNENGKEEKLLPGLNFTQDQLFFINYAQLWCSKIRDSSAAKYFSINFHSPSEFRVKGPIENSEIFFDLFNCKNKPRKQDQCSLWSNIIFNKP